MKILTDEVEERPVLGFEQYADCLVDVIINTEPRFCIGIYGEWGTGKTTLMQLIRDKLSDQKSDILAVWFNAWRYEREEHYAILAMLKTIAFAMTKHEIYDKMRPVLLNSLKIGLKGVAQGLAALFLGDKDIVNWKDEDIFPYLEFLAKFDKDTIYFDGIRNIEEEMKKIWEKYPKSRIVVFIDDLDRCSPKRALEVFESVKVFLDIEGFVFVMGLSHETIVKLIEAEYKTSGIKGAEYIRKIIQIPFLLPSWNESDTKDIIDNLLEGEQIDEESYRQVIVDHKDLISSIVEPIPREVKRFINSFLISYKIYSLGENIKPKELFLIQAIKFRWFEFYKLLSSDEQFRKLVKDLLGFDYRLVSLNIVDPVDNNRLYDYYQHLMSLESEKEFEAARQAAKENLHTYESSAEFREYRERYPGITEDQYIKKKGEEVQSKLGTLKSLSDRLRAEYRAILDEIDANLWFILQKEKDTIFNIKNWETYRRATEITREIPTKKVGRSFTGVYDVEGHEKQLSS